MKKEKKSKSKKKIRLALKPRIEKLALDAIEKKVEIAFRKFISVKLAEILNILNTPLTNAKPPKKPKGISTKAKSKKIVKKPSDALKDSLKSGLASYKDGVFKGKISLKESSHLMDLGARYSKKKGGFVLKDSEVPKGLKTASEFYSLKGDKVLKALSNINVTDFLDSLDLPKIADVYFTKESDDFSKKLESIGVKFSDDDKITEGLKSKYLETTDKKIKGFFKKDIAQIREHSLNHFKTGDRSFNLSDYLNRGFKLSENRIKFISRQELRLASSAYKEQKALSAGSEEYIWHTVSGTVAHPVRPSHKKLNKTKNRWDSPPEVDSRTGRKAHPGEDFNCRCYAEAIIEF